MSQGKNKPPQRKAQQNSKQTPAGTHLAAVVDKRGSQCMTEEQLRRVAAELKRAICDISGMCKTKLQGIVDEYPGAISLRLAHEGDSRLPRTVRRHGRDTGRSEDSTFGDLLCFHIGNTILAFYDEACGIPNSHLRARLEHLKEIAKDGPGNYVPYGSNARGFMLVHFKAAAKWNQEQAERDRQRWED